MMFALAVCIETQQTLAVCAPTRLLLASRAPNLQPRCVRAGIRLHNALHAGVRAIGHGAKVRDVGLVDEEVGVVLHSIHYAFGLVFYFQNGALEGRAPRLYHALQGRGGLIPVVDKRNLSALGHALSAPHRQRHAASVAALWENRFKKNLVLKSGSEHDPPTPEIPTPPMN